MPVSVSQPQIPSPMQDAQLRRQESSQFAQSFTTPKPITTPATIESQPAPIDPLDSAQADIDAFLQGTQDFTMQQPKPMETVMAETGQQSTLDNMSQPRQVRLEEAKKKAVESGYDLKNVEAYAQTISPQGKGGISESLGDASVTQPFGRRSSVEKYSGGVNLGTDFATPMNTPLSAPDSGSWIVTKASSGWNQGSGNMVQITNTKTGETIGYEHLNKIGVKPGQKIQPGQVVGLSGTSGNSTGPHASLPYQNAKGQYKDIRSTPYF